MINVNVLKQLRSEYVNPPDVHETSLSYEDELINFEFRDSERSPLAFSRSFIKEIIDNYWKTVCQQKKVDFSLREANVSFSKLSYEELRLANKIGFLVGNMDAVSAGYYVSSIYAKIMPPERRASLGVFYTPPAIVDRVLENVTGNGFDWGKGKILDPACGGGAFLAPLALKLLKESGCKDLYIALEDIERKLKGYEIDGFAAWMSMVFLDAALLDVYKVVKRKIKNIVEVRDTLTLAVENNEFFDLIIGNPPYGKISLQPYLRKFYSRSLYGHANLYGLFMDAALRLSNPGGMIAFVTSTSYLGGMYFKALRRLFKHEAPPVLMDFIEERKGVFDEVLQETMLTLFHKGAEKTPGININVVKVNGSESSITVEHIGRFILNSRDKRPDQVTKMTDENSVKLSNRERIEWRENSLIPGKMKDIPNCWYAANTREPIRDETLRMGLIQLGAVSERRDLPTTSSKPRYCLKIDFSELFNETLTGKKLLKRIEQWQNKSLSAGALARIKLLKQGIVASETSEGVYVKFPNGETRRMAAGPSSAISKAVIEEFTVRFLKKPGVIFLSESGNKIVARDDQLASSIGLKIEPDKNLPDIILVDIEPEYPLIVFVEVVATDGAINQMRKEALLEIALSAGFHDQQIAFVTAFMDRNGAAYRKLSGVLAWGTFAWFVTEPDNIVIYREETVKHGKMLYELI